MAGPWDQFKPVGEEGAKPWEQFKSEAPAPSPAKPEQSFLGNVADGVGSAFSNLALGVRQRGAEVGSYLEDRLGGQTSLNRALGIAPAAQEKQRVQSRIDQRRVEDAPLMQTAGGKVGNFIGQVLPAAGAALIPGGQGLAATLGAGALLGGAQPTSGEESALMNAAGGAAGGALGFGAGKLIGAGVGKLTASRAAARELNAVRDGVAASARESGYVIPPTQTNPTILNRTLEGLAGKLTTGQSASIKNQAITNKTVARAIGLDPSKPITKESLAGLRQQASQAYAAVTGAGDIVPPASYTAALDDIVKPYVSAAESFPNARPNPIIAEIETLRTPQFTAESAVNKIRELRAQADTAYAGGNKDLGKALRDGAGALEDAIDSHLQTVPGADTLLDGFRAARQLIAKTYTVEKALNESTGNVAARKLAAQLARGKPLSGDIKKVAQFAQAFPKAADEVASSMPGISPLDFYGAGGLSAMTGNPLSMLAIGARPIARGTILSQPFQRGMGAPSYNVGAALRGLGSGPGQAGLRLTGMGLGLPSGPQLSEEELQQARLQQFPR